MSDQATLGDESEREDPSTQGTSFDEKEFVRRLFERQVPMCYLMIFTKMHSSMKRTKRMEDNFHPIFS